MKRAGPIVVLLLVLAASLLVVAGPRLARERARTRKEQTAPDTPELLKLRHDANELYRSGKYQAAIGLYQAGIEMARRRGYRRSAIRFLNNLGSANYQLLRYRDAVKAYLEARSIAASENDLEMLAAACFNLSSLYFQMGEMDAASEAASQGLAVPAASATKFRSELLIQSALIDLRQSDRDRARERLRQAIDESRAQLDVGMEAQAWNELGKFLIESGSLPAAESALLESYRLRILTHDQRLYFSYESLAELRLSQKDQPAALRMLDRAVESAEPLGPSSLWRPLYERGRALLALGRSRSAFDDLQSSLRNLRNWRAQVLPADAFRVGAEVELHGVYSAFIEAAGRLYHDTRDHRYAEDAFAAAENERAASLRMLWAGSGRPRQLPEEYWHVVNDLRRAESAQFQSKSNSGSIRALRVRMAEMEAAAGLDGPGPIDEDAADGRKLLTAACDALPDGAAYFGFHVGESQSTLWVVARTGFELLALPPGAELERKVAEFVQSLREDPARSRELGARLYGSLFGGVSASLRAVPDWVLAADGPLLELPFAALNTADAAHPRYLIEEHSVRRTTGVWALARPAPSASGDLYVGMGDPIYNRADPRFSGPRRGPLLRPAAVAMELPRLLGSGREVEACAGIWRAQGQPVLLLEGAAANRQGLADALRRRPAVLHIAAHMLFPPRQTSPGMLAFSLQPSGEMDLLSETDTAGTPSGPALVVLNGCSSGRGAVLPGAGLMGMTRAWLAAGARAVIATRWPTPDQDGGGIFPSFYNLYFRRRERGPISFGALLRDAQLAELRAGGARGEPSHWAAYFCVERN